MRTFFLVLAIVSAVIFAVALTRAYTVEEGNAAAPATQIATLAFLATAGTYLKNLALAREAEQKTT